MHRAKCSGNKEWVMGVAKGRLKRGVDRLSSNVIVPSCYKLSQRARVNQVSLHSLREKEKGRVR